MPPRRYLDRSRLASKQPQSVTIAVTGQIDQDVDTVTLDTVHQTIIRPLRDIVPPVGELPERLRDVITCRRVGITHDFELCLVAVFKNRSVCVGCRTAFEFS